MDVLKEFPRARTRARTRTITCNVEPFFFEFGFLINHSRTMADTSVRERGTRLERQSRIFEHLSADVCKAEHVSAGEALKFHPLHPF